MSAIVAYASGISAEGRYFYVWMAAAFVLVAFGGFVPTYWVPVIAGLFHAPPIIHVHGMLMFAWTLFYLTHSARRLILPVIHNRSESYGYVLS